MSKQKTGLGKGLSALIRSAPQAEPVAIPAPVVPETAKSEGSISEVEVQHIRPNPFQPRADFDPQALDELKQSIAQKGIIQPVTVRRSRDGKFELISGERRIRAVTELGLKTIPAYIIQVKNDEEMLELALIENLQREHLNPVEIAISYQRLMRDVNLSAEDVARKIGKDRTTVVNFLRLLKLPETIQLSLRKGDISMGHARALVSLPDEQTQTRLFKRILKSGLSVRQVEQLVRESDKKSARVQTRPGKSTHTGVSSLEEKIQHALGTKVRVNLHGGGKGEIVIEFYSNDDLGRIFDLLSSIEH
jgi:ParB family chromosome partitioning protein